MIINKQVFSVTNNNQQRNLIYSHSISAASDFYRTNFNPSDLYGQQESYVRIVVEDLNQRSLLNIELENYDTHSVIFHNYLPSGNSA